MSVAMPSHRIGSEPFALLARIFNGLKRRGRVIDVIWFQQSADYARAVLALADECDDDDVRKMGATLRVMLGAYVAPPVVVTLPEPAAERTGRMRAVTVPASDSSERVAEAMPALPDNTVAEPPPAAPPEIEGRYVGRLR